MRKIFISLALIVLFGAPGWAFTIAQNKAGADATGNPFAHPSLTITAPTNGDTIMGYVQWYEGGSGYNTLTQVAIGSQNAVIVDQNSQDAVHIGSFYLSNTQGGATSIVLSGSGGNGTSDFRFWTIFMQEVRGALALDGHVLQVQQLDTSVTCVGTNNVSSGNITPAQPGDLLYGGTISSNLGGGCSANNSAAPLTLTAGTNFTLENTDPQATLFDENENTYNSASAVAATFSWSWGVNPAGAGTFADWVTAIMAFRPSSSSILFHAPW